MNTHEAVSYLRLIDSRIIHMKGQGPSRTSNESKEEERRKHALVSRVASETTGAAHSQIDSWKRTRITRDGGDKGGVDRRVTSPGVHRGWVWDAGCGVWGAGRNLIVHADRKDFADGIRRDPPRTLGIGLR